jgi:hypothetical protein
MDSSNPYEPDRNPTEPEWESADSGDGFDEPSSDDTDDAQMLCPHCLAPNLPLADFCHKCCGPISSLATMDPYKNIFAQGWAYGRAVSNPTKPIILWGMLLIFGVPVLAFAVTTLWDLVEIHRYYSSFQSSYATDLIFILPIGLLLLNVTICWRVVRRYRDLRHLQPGKFCTECNCDLRSWTEPRCPKCDQSYRRDDDHDLENDDLEDAYLEDDDPA